MEIFKLIKKLRKDEKLAMSYTESLELCLAVLRTNHIRGHIAELGVYKGGSATLICKLKGDKQLHLFDTFEGLPEPHKIKDIAFKKGDYSFPLDVIQSWLKSFPDVNYYKGMFPSTAKPISEKRFSFVNLDADLYQSTLDGLKFFYPRLNKGGIIMAHDYRPNKGGVGRAFREYFEDEMVKEIQLKKSHCIIQK